ncbi:MAG TPA: DUF2341 domain-containing protein [Candidatus Woesebacteria bacterium]|nr:DUF2341 domain-containing protein [Candidatus Woesebacteria bacterium]
MAWNDFLTKLFAKKKHPSQQKKRIWTILLIVLPFLLGLVLYSLTQVKEVAAQWWDETWLYRRVIEISNSNAEELTDFQVSLTIDTATLIADGKMQSNCGDLRITDWDGNLLPHWIEEGNPGCNSTHTKVWVKVPTIYRGNNATSIFVYYGNSNVNNIENGRNVFQFFEDFADYSGWIGETNNFTIGTDGSRQVLRVNGSNAPGEIFKAANLDSNNYIVEIAIRTTSDAANQPHPGFIFASNGTTADYYGVYLRAASNQLVETHNGSFGSFISSQSIDTNWHVYKAKVHAGVLESLYADATRQTAFDNWDISNSYSHVGIWSHDAGTAYYDNFFVRSYAANEPTIALSDTEEISPAPIAYWKFDETSGLTAYDASGQDNHGTVNTASWKGAEFCISGPCLDFPGNGFVSVADSQTLDFGTKDFTISAWALHRDYTYPKSNLMIKKSNLCYSDGVQNAGFDLGHGYKSTGIDVCLRDNSNNYLRTTLTYDPGSRPADLLNQWVHYSFVFDRTHDKLLVYINGKKQSSELDISAITGSINSTQPLTIGTMYGWKTDGLMDEIKIYPYARNAEQINADYVVGASKIGSKAVIGEKAGAVPPASLPSKLIAHWQFNEGSGATVNDTSGQNNHGTIISNASWTNSGKSGKALIFDGAAARIQNIPPTPFEYRGQDYSISLWYKRGNSDDQSNLLSKPWNGSGQYNYRIYLSSTDSLFFYLQGASLWSTQINNFSTREEWTHLGITLNATSKEVKIYRNGKLIQTTTHNISDWTPTSGNSNLSLCIGSLYPYGSSWTGNTTFSFEGSLDEIKFYNSTLSPEEMLQDYNFGMSTIMGQSPETPAGTTGSAASEYCVPGDTNPCAPPVAEWNFNENSGLVLTDNSGNNHHGNLINMTNSNWIKGPTSLGSALHFDGNNYVQAGSNMITGSSAFTLQGWFKAGSHSDFGLGVSIGNANTSQAAWLGWCGSANLGTSNSIGGGFYGRNYGSGITDNDWHFVSLTFSGGTNGTARLYVDGKVKTTDTYTPDLQATAIMFGKANTGTSYWYSGAIDNVKIYNYARSPAQIAWDYNRGAPVAHWRLDECQGNVAHDASSNNLHGIININSSGSQNALGTCTSGNATEAWYNGREGIFGSSLSFDGTDDYIDLGNGSGIRDFTDQITVSAWAKYNAYGGGGQSYSVIAVKGSPWTFLLENYSRKIRFRVTVGGLDKNATDSQVHELNRWYHFVGTYDGANIKIYKDGKLVGTTPATGNLAVSDVTAKIGTYQGTNYNFNGQIDDVRIYNYALTQEQIKLLYNDNAAVRF